MEMWQGASLLSRPAEEFGNDSLVEEMWAMRAMEHAEIYFNLLISVPPSCIHLTPYDDVIYRTFRQDFPELKVDVLADDILKSDEAKIRWRLFAEKFNKLDDYAYGTMLRADASKEFSPENSLLVVRIQFLAIEIARNREGYNNEVHQKFRPPPHLQPKVLLDNSNVNAKSEENQNSITTKQQQNTGDSSKVGLVLENDENKNNNNIGSQS